MKTKDAIREIRYSLHGVASYTIWRTENKWRVVQSCGGALDDVRLMSGERAGGDFDSFEDAEGELQRIFDAMLSPLTRKEIVRHFNMKWMRREEQGPALIKFRERLLAGDMRGAKRIYKTLSHWTCEAIPEKVLLHLLLKI